MRRLTGSSPPCPAPTSRDRAAGTGESFGFFLCGTPREGATLIDGVPAARGAAPVPPFPRSRVSPAANPGRLERPPPVGSSRIYMGPMFDETSAFFAGGRGSFHHDPRGWFSIRGYTILGGSNNGRREQRVRHRPPITVPSRLIMNRADVRHRRAAIPGSAIQHAAEVGSMGFLTKPPSGRRPATRTVARDPQGAEISVGVRGFEPRASCPPDKRANQAAPHPESRLDRTRERGGRRGLLAPKRSRRGPVRLPLLGRPQWRFVGGRVRAPCPCGVRRSSACRGGRPVRASPRAAR